METSEKILVGIVTLKREHTWEQLRQSPVLTVLHLHWRSNICQIYVIKPALSERQKAVVLHAASDDSGNDLAQCLDVLKNSDLKYSLVTDLMAFAKSDGDYADEERESIEKISGVPWYQ